MKFIPLISAPLPWLMSITSLFKKSDRREDPVLKKLKRQNKLFPRTLVVTAVGKRFLALLILIGIAAINTGNNLLYLIVAILLSIIIISGFLSEATLKSVDIKRTIPKTIYKNTKTYFLLTAENKKKFLPSYSFKLLEYENPDLQAKHGYFMKIRGKENANKRVSYEFAKRGLIKLYAIKMTTKFPFGIISKTKLAICEEDILVLPKIQPVNGIDNLNKNMGSSTPSRHKGYGTDIHSLRDYVTGEDVKRIHWKMSAKKSKLVYMERLAEDTKSVTLYFDNYKSSEQQDEKENELFELAVDKAASYCAHFIKRGFKVTLKTLEDETVTADSKEGLLQILKTLALLEPINKIGILNMEIEPDEN